MRLPFEAFNASMSTVTDTIEQGAAYVCGKGEQVTGGKVSEKSAGEESADEVKGSGRLLGKAPSAINVVSEFPSPRQVAKDWHSLGMSARTLFQGG